jgi:hypothetical protein
VRAGGVALGADAEEFGLDRVEVVPRVQALLEDGVQGLEQALARAAAVGGGVLHAVGNPQVGQAGCAQRAAEGGADFAAAAAVLDPETPHRGVGRGEGEAVPRARVGEEGLVEIQAQATGFGPGDPGAEVLRGERVAVHAPAAGLGVAGVEVEAVPAGNERQRLLEVGAQFIGRAGLARVIAGDGQPAAGRGAGVFKAADVVALPAVNRDGDAGEGLECGVGVHTGLGVAFAGEAVGAFDEAGGGGHGFGGPRRFYGVRRRRAEHVRGRGRVNAAPGREALSGRGLTLRAAGS